MASKNTLRGAAAGLFLAGALLSAFHYFQPETVSQSPELNETESLNNDTESNLHLEELERELSALKNENEALSEQIETLETESQNNGEGSDDSHGERAEYRTILDIEEGMTSSHISSLLQQLHIIESSASFEQIIQEENAGHLIQVGTYELSSNMSKETIIEMITSSN